jgi:hypothetical protein
MHVSSAPTNGKMAIPMYSVASSTPEDLSMLYTLQSIHRSLLSLYSLLLLFVCVVFTRAWHVRRRQNKKTLPNKPSLAVSCSICIAMPCNEYRPDYTIYALDALLQLIPIIVAFHMDDGLLLLRFAGVMSMRSSLHNKKERFP